MTTCDDVAGNKTSDGEAVVSDGADVCTCVFTAAAATGGRDLLCLGAAAGRGEGEEEGEEKLLVSQTFRIICHNYISFARRRPKKP